MNDYPPTAHLCEHARQRCAEMGISTKVAKQIMRDPVLVIPARPGPAGQPRSMVRGRVHSEYVLIVDTTSQEVVTVLYWSPETAFSREAC